MTTGTAPTIVELFALHGAPVTSDADSPLPLIDPGAVFLVASGHLDVVAMTIIHEKSAMDLSRTHLMRVQAGHVLFGLDAPRVGTNVLLLGFGSAGVQLYRLPAARLAQLAKQPEARPTVAALVDRWVSDLCTLIASDLPPTVAQNLKVGVPCELQAGQSAQPQSGVLWVRGSSGTVRFLGAPLNTGEGDFLFPVGRDAWLLAERACMLEACAGTERIGEDSYWRGLDSFHTAVEALIDVQRMRERKAAKQRLEDKSASGRSSIETALGDLRATLAEDRTVRRRAGTDGGLLAACRMVGDAAGIEIRGLSLGERRSGGMTSPLEQIAKSSRFRVRRVRLKAGWWKIDAGPLLGFVGPDQTPVALIPDARGVYAVHDPAEGSLRPVARTVAEQIRPDAFVFYRSLPDHALGGMELIRFGLRGLRRDLVRVMLLGAAGGLLSLAAPLAIGHVFDSVVPGARRDGLLQMAAAVAVAGLAGAAFRVTRNIAVIRLENRAGPALQAAVWDRLLNLPARFFTQYSAGDLALRAMGIESILKTLSATAINAALTAIFSLFSLGLLVMISPGAALAAIGLCAIVVVVVMVSGYLQFRHQRRLQEMAGKMASLLLQFMNGIAKIRVAAAEDRAFGQWAARFAEQTRVRLRARTIGNNLNVFVVTYPVLATMVIYYLIAPGGPASASMSTGTFLAFISAFASFLFGLLDLGSILVGVIAVAPVYERLRPILRAIPEIDRSKTETGLLRGRIEVSNITFRYNKDDPPILNGVSLHADPGEFVALVGPSGSGKSTLLRILLGFEQPESGAVFYDGFDAAGLDVQGLRRQCGVVLQDGELMPGDIFTNIVGSSIDLSVDNAWEAARMAGLDGDIEEMPMGMHTVLSEGAATLSGGQRQRLMIARALVTKPRIVFFDEATSALDNPTQAKVTASLDRLNCTRIVIAHRLSTIVNADRIYVLDEGKVAQVGTYQQLMNEPGLFVELARRQIA